MMSVEEVCPGTPNRRSAPPPHPHHPCPSLCRRALARPPALPSSKGRSLPPKARLRAAGMGRSTGKEAAPRARRREETQEEMEAFHKRWENLQALQHDTVKLELSTAAARNAEQRRKARSLAGALSGDSEL